MIKALASLLAKPRTLHAELELDHVELCGDQLILGLQVAWSNHTLDPVEIRGVLINVFPKGRKDNSVEMIYHGRFVRIPYQKTITKISGARSFQIEPGAKQVEYLRFLTHDIPDLIDGVYAAELHSTVEDGTYVHDFELKIVSRLKHRVAGSEMNKDAAATKTSSIYTRALRLGLDSKSAANAPA